MITKIEVEPPFAFRFRPDSKYTTDEILNSYIYFQDPKKLNDPFDCDPNLMSITENEEELRKIFSIIQPNLSLIEKENFQNEIARNDFKSFRYFLRQFLDEYVSQFAVACFTMTPANYLMWSHYANFHKGICIQYDTSKDKELFAGIQPVRYVDKYEVKEYFPLSEENDFMHIFLTKSMVWQNEHELRVVKDSKGKMFHNKNAVKKIIFGLQSTEEFKKEIINVALKTYDDITFFNVEPLIKEFGIGLKQIM